MSCRNATCRLLTRYAHTTRWRAHLRVRGVPGPGDRRGPAVTGAKAKTKAAKISYRVPSREDLFARVTGVLGVLYLIFNEAAWPRMCSWCPARSASINLQPGSAQAARAAFASGRRSRVVSSFSIVSVIAGCLSASFRTERDGSFITCTGLIAATVSERGRSLVGVTSPKYSPARSTRRSRLDVVLACPARMM